MNAALASPELDLAWRRALARAAWTVWLQTLAPVVSGMLRDCGHCVTSYWLSVPMVPGALLPVLLQLHDAWFFAVGGIVALLLFGLTALVLRELPPKLGYVAQAIVSLAVAAEAVGFAAALRA